MGVDNLPRVATQQCDGRESNSRSVDHESDVLTTIPPSHGSEGFDLVEVGLREERMREPRGIREGKGDISSPNIYTPSPVATSR